MTRTPARPPALHGTIFRGSEQVRAGVLTPAQLRSSAWRRLFPDVYACASLPITHHRRARAVGGLLRAGAVLSGRSAAVLWGVDLTDPDGPVEITLDEAVVALDQVLRSRLVTLPDLRAAAAATTGPGYRGIRLAATHADGLAQSPQETRVRLLVHGSALPRPAAQHVVRDAEGRFVVRDAEGQFVAQVDFGWPEHRVALEYDGVWHGGRSRSGRTDGG